MRNIKCYDNGGKTADRYTVVYLDDPQGRNNLYGCVGMDDHPFHPQGIGQHSTAMLGRHLGKRITFEQLPADCQKLVNSDLQSLLPLSPEQSVNDSNLTAKTQEDVMKKQQIKTQAEINEFRKEVRTCWPYVSITIKTVSFQDLARTERKCLTVSNDKPGDMQHINALARKAGIVPDGSIRYNPKVV